MFSIYEMKLFFDDGAAVQAKSPDAWRSLRQRDDDVDDARPEVNRSVRRARHGNVAPRGAGFTGRMRMVDCQELPARGLGFGVDPATIAVVDGEAIGAVFGVDGAVELADFAVLSREDTAALVRRFLAGMSDDLFDVAPREIEHVAA